MAAMPRTWVERDNMYSRLNIDRPARRRIGKFASQHEIWGRDKFHLTVVGIAFNAAEMAVAAFALQQDHMERAFGVLLTRVSLVKCSITASSVPYLLAGMRACQTVVDWDLSCNAMGAAGVGELCAIIACKPGVMALNIAATRILDLGLDEEESGEADAAGTATDDGGGLAWKRDGVAGVAELLRASRGLIVLDISRNHLGIAGMDIVGAGIADAVAVRQLAVAGNEISAPAAALLARGVGANRTLTALDASGNKFGGAGAAELAVMARQNRGLRVLNLHGSRIDDVSGGSGGRLLVAFRASFITTLDLSGNPIGSTGAALIGKNLLGLHLSSLRDVDLTNCLLTDDGTDLAGIKVLADGIGANQTVLKYVLVKNNIVPRDFRVRDTRKDDLSAVAGFADAIRANRVFVTLDLRENGLEYRARKLLLVALAESDTGLPDAVLVKELLERVLAATEKRQPVEYARLTSRWLRVRVIRSVLDYIAEPRQIITH